MNNLKQLKQELEETKNKCAEIEKKIEELSKELEESKCKLDKEKSNNYTRWKASYGEIYYYICGDGEIFCNTERNNEFSTKNYDLGNYFQTEEEAKNVVEKIKIYTQLKDLALRLNKGREICWNDFKQVKYCISRDVEYDELIDIPTRAYQEMGQIYCLDSNFFDIAKREIGEENLRKLFE